MLDNRERILSEIKDRLAIYATRVRWEEGKLSDGAEKLYCGLLNAMFDCNLKNMNRERPNFPAIDLGNDQEYVQMEDCAKPVRLGVQVTSTVTGQKVKHSLEEFFDHELNKRFDRLIVLVAGKVKPFDKEPELKEQFDFQTRRDIWDEKKLIEVIGYLSDERLESVWDFLHKRLKISDIRPELNLPLQRTMKKAAFVGREAELRRIEEEFQKDSVVVLSGLGGIGKTELAVRYGRDYEEDKRGRAYQVLYAGSFDKTLESSVSQGIPNFSAEGKKPEQIRQAALDALNACGGEDLLILDNADTGSMNELLRALGGLKMKVLVTTRMDVPGAVEVKPLSLESLYDVFDYHGVKLPREQMKQLIETVSFHTLTVDMIARTLRRGAWIEVEDLLAALKTGMEADEFTEVEIDYAASPGRAQINEHLKAVFRVANLSENARSLLRCAVLLPGGGMGERLFRSFVEKKARAELDDLIEGGWLFRDIRLLKIHPVIRIVCQEELKPSDESCGAFLEALIGRFDEDKFDQTEYLQMAQVLEEAADRTEDRTGRWALKAGEVWWKLGDVSKPLEFSLRAMERAEKNLGQETPEYAYAVNNVGVSFGVKGEHKKALEYVLKALEIRERVLLPDDPDLASSYNNVGSTYDDLGDHKQALEYQLKALAIRERVLLPEHPDLAISYGNVGSTYRALGEPQKALEYELKVISIFEKVLPKDHPHLATSYNNVGDTYGALGDHKQALEYKLKALTICERVLPPEHPSLATSYNNVGSTYYAQGNYEKALEYQQKALVIRERVLPGNHPSLALSFNNIAWTYYRLGRIREAATHMRRAADIINRSSLPETHPKRVSCNKWAERLEAEARQEETV